MKNERALILIAYPCSFQLYKKIYMPILKKYAVTIESMKKICYYIMW